VEIFGILLSIPVAFAVSMTYCALLANVARRFERLRFFLIVASSFILMVFLLEIVLLLTLGAVRSRAVVGPGFYVVHIGLFFLGTPALANVLVLRERASVLGKWYVAGVICALFAVFLVFLQYGVSEALYGVDGWRIRQSVIAKANNAFALDLCAELKEQKGNLFFSPYSISAGLPMTYAGARGNTEKQMAEVLNFTLDQGQIHHAFDILQAQLNSVQKKGHIELSVANALWAQEDFDFIEDFVDLMRHRYRTGFNSVDFKNAPEAVGININTWVEEKTEGKIKDLIRPGALDSSTRLVLTNAIYFKGNWANKFDEFDTKVMPFRLNPEQSVNVPMMNQTHDFGYMENDSMQMLELPYIGDDLSMIVLLPGEVDGLAQLESSLDVDNLDSWMSRLRETEVFLVLPKFKMTFELDLRDALASMGMADAFDEKAADFSGMAKMNDGERIYISAVIHKTFVDVNERGTEAAAVTAVRALSAPPVFRADHPFLFLIRHNASGSILFFGRVIDPTE